MPFNEGKCKIIAFGNQNYKSLYKLPEVQMDWVDSTTYLGVAMQLNLNFDQHIALIKRIKPQKFWEQLNMFYMKSPEKVSYWPTLVCAIAFSSTQIPYEIQR